MTRLRPRLAADAGSYPARPVVYRRPVLRALTGGLVIFISTIDVSITFMKVEDGLKQQDWLWPLALVPTLGALYLYVASTLIVDRTHVIINNPLRRVRIPLAHVVDVVPGSNLKIVTRYKNFWAWGVEGANAQVALGKMGSQDTLRELILRASDSDGGSDEARARYRFRLPDPFFLTYLLVTLTCSVGLRLGYGANG